MEKQAFEYTVTHDASIDGVVVQIRGTVDAHSAPQLETILQEIVQQGARSVILDLSALEYISSAGLGVFMLIYEMVQEKGGKVLFAALPQKIWTVFDILGFTHLFQFAESVEQAKQQLGQNAVNND